MCVSWSAAAIVRGGPRRRVTTDREHRLDMEHVFLELLSTTRTKYSSIESKYRIRHSKLMIVDQKEHYPCECEMQKINE